MLITVKQCTRIFLQSFKFIIFENTFIQRINKFAWIVSKLKKKSHHSSYTYNITFAFSLQQMTLNELQQINLQSDFSNDH